MRGAKHRKPRPHPGLLPRFVQVFAAFLLDTVRHPQSLILLLLMGLTVWPLWTYTQRVDLFRVTHVVLPEDVAFTLREPILERNVWTLNLRALAEGLKQQQPWLKDVRVIRQLPSTVRIEAIPRVPVAQVRFERWHPVDRDGVILPQGTAEPAEQLVRIIGVQRSQPPQQPGHPETNERLTLALRLLQRFRRTPSLLSRRLIAINVSDPEQLRLVLDGDLEVRCGSEVELDAHLKRLRVSLRAVARHLGDIQTIDVRFQEPVVSPRT
jgi:cell division septal protein FtsQ